MAADDSLRSAARKYAAEYSTDGLERIAAYNAFLAGYAARDAEAASDGYDRASRITQPPD